MGVRLLGAIEIGKTGIEGLSARELSGLAWDEDEQVLYALSDDGYVLYLAPAFEDGQLTGIDLREAHLLREADGSPVADERADSEGLALLRGDNGIRGDSEWLVSYEIVPRVTRYSAAGEFREELPLPEPLRDIRNYADDNSALESVSAHPAHGVLVAPERPLRGDPPATIPVFSLDGRRFEYTPLDAEHSALVDLALAADGSILVLERRFASIFRPVIFSVRRLLLDAPPACGAPEPVAAGNGPGQCAAVADVVSFSSAEWRLDNFEGLTHHRDDRYFMVSDDNESAIQRTIMVYFEILEDEGRPTPVDAP
jgi:hypothetical protein